MKLLLAVILIWFISFPVFACDPDSLPQSWRYVSDTNVCVRDWDGGGEFSTLQECLKSRAGRVEFTWAFKVDQYNVHFDFNKYFSWTQANAYKGLFEQSYESIASGIGTSLVTSHQSYTGSFGVISPATKAEADSITGDRYSGGNCRPDRVCSKYYRWSKGDGAPFVNGEKKFSSGKIFAYQAGYDNLISLQRCKQDYYFSGKDRWGYWRSDSSPRVCTPISSSSYLVDTKYFDCIGGVCPSADFNYQGQPLCQDDPPGNDDDDDDDDDDDEENPDKECNLDNLDCIKNALNSIFPFDIFALPTDLSLICPALIFFGYEWDLCWAYEILRLLKYPILVSLAVKIWLAL